MMAEYAGAEMAEIFDLIIVQQIVIDIFINSISHLLIQLHDLYIAYQYKKQQANMIEQSMSLEIPKPKPGISITGMMTSLNKNNERKVLRTEGNKKIIQFRDQICQFVDDRYENGAPIRGEVVIRNRDNNRVVYEGEFFDSEKCGYGIDYDEKGEVLYEGQFVRGKRDGWGRTKEYEGQFKQDEYDGWGRFMTKEVYYEGYFLAGRYNGVGTYILAKQEFRHIDTLIKQTKMDEFLIAEIGRDQANLFQKFNLEQIYIGQWLKGLKNGLGKLWRENDYWYSGQFAYNSLHGHGVRRTHEMKTQKGVFVKGQFKGSF